MKKTSNLVYSIIGISLVLYLLGTIGWMAINGQSLSKLVKENVSIDVILNDNTSTEKAQELENVLNNQSFVLDATMISKEEALEKYVSEKGEDPVKFLGYNPLYISIKTSLHAEYVNPDSIAKIKTFIQQSNIVREVYYQEMIVGKLDTFIKNTGLVLGGLALVLFVAVIMIIDNTVKLSMFSNRMLVKTMQMVGATRFFIAKPFIKQAFFSGLISAMIAVIGMLGLRYLAFSIFPAISVLDNPMLFTILLISITLIGILISVLSTYRSVNKYLKLKLDELY